MRLSADRFFETQLADGTTRYGYESQQHLFDVDVRADGTVRYAVDCRTVEAPGPFHRAVVEHFRLFLPGDEQRRIEHT